MVWKLCRISSRAPRSRDHSEDLGLVEEMRDECNLLFRRRLNWCSLKLKKISYRIKIIILRFEALMFPAIVLNLPEERCRPVIPGPLLDVLTEKQGEEATVDILLGVLQKAVTHRIDLHRQRQHSEFVTARGVDRDIARPAALSNQHAGDWLNTVPSPSLGLHSTSDLLSSLYQQDKGLDVLSSPPLDSAQPVASDKEGDQGERFARHNQCETNSTTRP